MIIIIIRPYKGIEKIKFFSPLFNKGCYCSHTVIPLGFFKQSPFNGCFPSAQRHLFFLSIGSIPHDVSGVSRQSESVEQSRIPLSKNKKKRIFERNYSAHVDNYPIQNNNSEKKIKKRINRAIFLLFFDNDNNVTESINILESLK